SHSLHIFRRGGDEHLPLLGAASLLSQAVTALRPLGAPGFFWRQGQASFVPACVNEGCARRLPPLFCAPRAKAVLTGAHQVHLASSTPIARFRVGLPALLLSAVSSPMGSRG